MSNIPLLYLYYVSVRESPESVPGSCFGKLYEFYPFHSKSLPHVAQTKTKVCLRNNMLSTLTGTAWGVSLRTVLSFTLAVFYSWVQYGCHVCGRSEQVDSSWNTTVVCTQGCMRPTSLDNFHIPTCIAPSDIQRNAVEKELEKSSSLGRSPHQHAIQPKHISQAM